MSIEQARPAESRPAASAGHSSAGSRPQAADGGVGASFLALLGALDVGAEDLTPLGTTPGDDPLATGMTPRHGKADKSDKGGRRDGRGSLAADLADGAADTVDATGLTTDAPVDGASDPAKPDASATWPGTMPWAMVPTTVPQPSPVPVPGQAEDAAAGMLPNTDAAGLALGAEGAGRGVRVPVAPGPRGGESQAAPTAEIPQAATGAAARQEAAVASGARAASQRMAGQAQAAADAQASQRGQALQQALQQAQAAAPATAPHAAVRDGVSPESLGPALASALAAAAAEAPSVRGPSRLQERLEELRGAGPAFAAEGPTGRHALSADAPMPVATAQIDTGGAGMEDRMDAQVSYWLSQKTQSAELTLDTADGRSVEVRIAMNGNEANVQFRAEQAGTRELLGSALGQLQDSLGREGVVLAGVTVDNFGSRPQGDASSDAGRQGGGRGGSRRTLSIGEVAAGGAAQAARGGPNAAARGLDLYV